MAQNRKLCYPAWHSAAHSLRDIKDREKILIDVLGMSASILSPDTSSMDRSPSQPVTALLAKWQAGDEKALERLLPLVYEELRRIAHGHLQKERHGHTLQTTALVHEAYLRLTKEEPPQLESRAHFFAVSANLMRRILVEYARGRRAAKRGGGRTLTLDEATTLLKGKSTDLLALDDALNGLAQLDPRQSRIVELRFFAGLSIEDTSHVLGISPATVKRDWITARLWLYDQISRQNQRAKKAAGGEA
jgi:RNA polymerase sigma factor (TIGR02999 family)